MTHSVAVTDQCTNVLDTRVGISHEDIYKHSIQYRTIDEGGTGINNKQDTRTTEVRNGMRTYENQLKHLFLKVANATGSAAMCIQQSTSTK